MINAHDLRNAVLALFFGLLATVNLWASWALNTHYTVYAMGGFIFNVLFLIYFVFNIGRDTTIPVVGVVLVRTPNKKQETKEEVTQ